MSRLLKVLAWLVVAAWVVLAIVAVVDSFLTWEGRCKMAIMVGLGGSLALAVFVLAPRPRGGPHDRA